MTTKVAARRISGMGAISHDQGVAFRVWAPHADSVSVVGTFNHWDKAAHPLEAENDGYWYSNVADASIGDEYKFVITNGGHNFQRIDPYAREVTHSAGSGVIHDPSFD